MDYNAKIERCKKANEQLRREASVNRILVSEAIKLLIEYTQQTPDPLLSPGDKRNNPFIEKKTCIIL